MEWTSVVAAISLSILAVCSIILTINILRGKRITAFNPEKAHDTKFRIPLSYRFWIIASVVISISTLLYALFTIHPIINLSDGKTQVTSDYYVAILGVLVTALVGWQIFSLIRIEDIRREYRNIEQKSKNAEAKLHGRVSELNADLVLFTATTTITNYKDTKKDCKSLGMCYYLLAQAIINYMLAGKTKVVSPCINLMEVCIYYTHKHDAWSITFDDKNTKIIEEHYLAISSVLKYLTQDERKRIEQMRMSRANKKIQEELRMRAESNLHNE